MTYVMIFLGGLAGSLHCIGMCGGFALALADTDPRRRLLRQVLYNLGRLNTLVFIGALCGGFGAAVVAVGPVRNLEQALAVVTGSFMILVGLEVIGALRQITGRGALLVQSTLGRLLGGVMRSRSFAAPLALGVFNAFLPCQLIYAFAAQAASTASLWGGMSTMFCFGLGTIPAMMAVGVGGALARPALRARLSLLSGMLVIAFGAMTVLRGLDWLPHGAHPVVPAHDPRAQPHDHHHQHQP